MNTLTLEQLDMIKRLQPFFKERMGEWKCADEWFGDATELHGYIPATMICPKPHVLRIPKPIDWQNPERGLWGMIRGFKTLGEGTDCVCYVCDYIEVTGADPFTALLKALCEQEKV